MIKFLTVEIDTKIEDLRTNLYMSAYNMFLIIDFVSEFLFPLFNISILL